MGTASTTVRILITAADQGAGRIVGQTAEKVKGLDDAGKKAGSSSGGLSQVKGGLAKMGAAAGVATAVIAGAGLALKEAFELGEQGAAIVQTTDSFDGLIERLGLAPDLLQQLQDASNDTVPALELMKSTSTLLAGTQGELATELGNSTPRLMEIAKAANKLNPALGSVTDQYDSLALGIKRSSPMILDNLGLTIKIGEANEKYAESIGKTVGELTAEEEKLALLNATLEAGDVLIQQAGGNTDSMTDSFGEARAAIQNLTDYLKAEAAPTLAGMAEGITTLANGFKEFMQFSNDSHEAIDVLQKAVVESTEDYYDYYFEIQRINAEMPFWAGNVEAMTSAEHAHYVQMMNTKTGANAYSIELDNLRRMAYDASEGTEDLTGATEDLVTPLTDAQIQAGLLSGALSGLGLSAAEMAQAQIMLKLATGEINEEQAQQLQNAISLKAAYDTGKVSIEDYIEVIKDGVVTTAELEMIFGETSTTVTGLTDDIYGAEAEFLGLNETVTTVKDTAAGANARLGELGETVENLDGMSADIDVNVNVSGAGVLQDIFPDSSGERGGHAFGQHGLKMTVPSGYSEAMGKPFWFGASSGEEVTITPRNRIGQASSSGGAAAPTSGASINIGPLVVNTQATDAQGIVNRIMPVLRREVMRMLRAMKLG